MDGARRRSTVLADGVESFDDALAASPVVVEATYTTATQNHAAMEPHSAVAVWDDGELTVYSGNQASNIQAGGTGHGARAWTRRPSTRSTRSSAARSAARAGRPRRRSWPRPRPGPSAGR